MFLLIWICSEKHCPCNHIIGAFSRAKFQGDKELGRCFSAAKDCSEVKELSAFHPPVAGLAGEGAVGTHSRGLAPSHPWKCRGSRGELGDDALMAIPASLTSLPVCSLPLQVLKLIKTCPGKLSW